MIVAVVNEQTVVFVDGRIEVETGTVPERLERPVKAIRAVERVESGLPVIERVEAVVQPGTGEHFRAAVRATGGRIEFDGGDA